MATSSDALILDASQCPVKSVTIFQSSVAEITRTFAVDLKCGRNSIEISSISTLIDAESPRIHGLGSDARVGAISCTKSIALAPGQKPSKHAQALKAHLTLKNELEADRTALNKEADFLADFLRTGQNKEGGKSLHLPHIADISGRMRDATKEALALSDQIAALDREGWILNHTHTGDTAAKVLTTIHAKRDVQVEFQMTYLVSGVSWTPYYDLRATATGGKTSPDVTLLYGANIVQNTGEDWDEMALTLSTANSQTLHSLSIPVIDPLKVSPGFVPRPPPSRAPVPMFGAGAASSFGSGTAPHGGLFGASAQFGQQQSLSAIPTQTMTTGFGAFGSASQQIQQHTTEAFDVRDREREHVDDAPPSAPAGDSFLMVDTEDAGVQHTTLDRNPLALAYHVEGAVSIPSDGVAHKISVAALEFTSQLCYVCAPRKSQTAFIEAQVKNTSEYELLAGPVSVFMDESFVTKTSIGAIAVNQTFDCVLGVDTALRVAYTSRSRTEYEPPRNFSERTKTTTRTVTSTLTNNHAFDITGLVVRDAIPIGDKNANVQVVLRKPEGLLQSKDGEDVSVKMAGEGVYAKVRWTKVEDGKGGEKDGIYEWVCNIAAGKKVELEAEWDVKAPANLRWTEDAVAK